MIIPRIIQQYSTSLMLTPRFNIADKMITHLTYLMIVRFKYFSNNHATK